MGSNSNSNKNNLVIGGLFKAEDGNINPLLAGKINDYIDDKQLNTNKLNSK